MTSGSVARDAIQAWIEAQATSEYQRLAERLGTLRSDPAYTQIMEDLEAKSASLSELQLETGSTPTETRADRSARVLSESLSPLESGDDRRYNDAVAHMNEITQSADFQSVVRRGAQRSGSFGV